MVLNFLRKKVGIRDGDGLFCYVNSVFAPGLDEGVGNLFRVSVFSSSLPFTVEVSGMIARAGLCRVGAKLEWKRGQCSRLTLS